MQKLRTAIIDIGSNTIRLSIYQYHKDEGFHEINNIKTVARLRQYILPTGEMSEEGIYKLLYTLISFKHILDDYGVTEIQYFATAAIRQASNNKQIIEKIREESGIKITILSEEEEAYFGFLAIVNSMDTSSAVTIDMGGGSTEVTLFENKKLLKSHSFPFGTVSLKQRFVKGTIMEEDERKELHAFLKEQFETLDWVCHAKLPIIAIGGSARNIAQVHQQQNKYPMAGVHQYEMHKSDLVKLKKDLGDMTYEQLKQLDGLSSDRADTITPALEVFTTFMSVVDTKSFQLSKKGLREGLIIKELLHTDAEAFNKYNVLEENVKRLAFRYGRSKEEMQALASLSKQFYLECCKLELLSFSEDHLELIQRAAKVFSIGEFIDLDSVDQHTFYLLVNQTIDGMNHLKRLKLALLASYKNNDYLRQFASPFKSWLSREELKELRSLGAILKFIYALNVSKRNVVSSLTMELAEDVIYIHIFAGDSVVAEVYEAERTKKHIERLFKRQVVIHFSEEGCI